jgi:hypothetical protein
VHEWKKETAQAAVHMHWDAILLTQLEKKKKCYKATAKKTKSKPK